jgi:ribosomal protein L16 Arg81 hydroxylase
VAATYSLAQLLHPITPAAFEADYRETKPLLVKRGDSDYYAELLTMKAVDRVITTMHPKYPDVFLTNALTEIKPAEFTYPSGLIDAGRIYGLFADGGTIVMSNLELQVDSLANLCRSLERETSARFQANVYLTPHNAQGFRRHYDAHDVFVVQLEGSKHWRVYDTPVQLPLPGEPFDPRDFEIDPNQEPSMEFDLEAGDVFYLPRGMMHDAVSTQTASLHITIGTFGPSWVQLLLEAVAKVGVRHEEMRRTLPTGFAQPDFDRRTAKKTFDRLLEIVAAEADFDAALDHFADDLVSSRHSLLVGQLEQILRLPELLLDTVVGARPNLLYHLRRDDDQVHVSCYGSSLHMPIHAADALAYALEHERFAVKDLPGDLDDEGKLVLVERLIRDGLVRQL